MFNIMDKYSVFTVIARCGGGGSSSGGSGGSGRNEVNRGGRVTSYNPNDTNRDGRTTTRERVSGMLEGRGVGGYGQTGPRDNSLSGSLGRNGMGPDGRPR